MGKEPGVCFEDRPWEEGRLLEEQGDKVLGLEGGEGKEFLRPPPPLSPLLAV